MPEACELGGCAARPGLVLRVGDRRARHERQRKVGQAHLLGLISRREDEAALQKPRARLDLEEGRELWRGLDLSKGSVEVVLLPGDSLVGGEAGLRLVVEVMVQLTVVALGCDASHRR